MKPQEIKLLKILSNNDVTFFIPPYQRRYEWTEEQCETFWDDVLKVHDKNEKGINTEHFFGTVVYFPDDHVFGQPEKLILIDGQQRITTTMLFLAAVRDILSKPELKQYINKNYLRNDNVSADKSLAIKLKQVELDGAIYKHIILGEEVEPIEKNTPVYHNYQYFYNKLNEYTESGHDVEPLIEKGLEKFSIVTIQLEPNNSWENPQGIFESMNSLGKPLSLADLVRNYLLLGLDAEKQENLYKKYWFSMEREIQNNVSDFIRDFMQMKGKCSYKKATEGNYKDLYRAFKTLFSDADTEGLMKDLNFYARIYAYIIPGKSCSDDKIAAKLDDLKRLRVTTAYSFLMALLGKWQEGKLNGDDIANILEAFRIYCLRKRLIKLTSAENKGFPLLVNQIDKLIEAKDKKQIMFEILANQDNTLRVPNDREIKSHLEEINFYNFQYSKFYLSLVEEKLTKVRPDLENQQITIEHIMPQTLSDEWKKQLGRDYDEVHQALLNTIGNLTLTTWNQELGNKSFSEKKEFYENKTGLQIAKTEIINRMVWDETAIKARARWIIDYLLKEVLPIPAEMQRQNNFKEKKPYSSKEVLGKLIGETIYFFADPTIEAKVVSDSKVEFEGKKWSLSPLTKEIQMRRGAVNLSGAYQGGLYWKWRGDKLIDVKL